MQEAPYVFRALAHTAGRFADELNRLFGGRRFTPSVPRPEPPPAPKPYQPLRRVLLTDGVARALFEEYAAHRQSDRREEETGWVLLGVRGEEEALVVATLPAGTDYDAGAAHVRFNIHGQAMASRIVRQADKRLTILGVVHTHPGSLRHPSEGDFRGDSEWVGNLRAKEGIFGIGTVDGESEAEMHVASQPRPNVQCWHGLRLSWYALGQNDRRYRPLPVHVTLGPDLARPLHSVWTLIEKHAPRLDRLCRQQAGVRFELVSTQTGPALIVKFPLAASDSEVKITLREKEEHYHVSQDGQTFEVKPEDDRVDRAVYLILAELAGQDR
jgi:proteasome lid subunit RPN8/RPN11